jgi:hypothetical protein
MTTLDNARAELARLGDATLQHVRNRTAQVERLSGGPWWVFASYQEWVTNIGCPSLSLLVGSDRIRLVDEFFTEKEVA